MSVEPPDMERPFGRSVEFLMSTGHIQAAKKVSWAAVANRGRSTEPRESETISSGLVDP